MTFTDITTPNWKMVGDMQKEIDILHAENVLKLTQILDLEQLVYDLRDRFHWESDLKQEKLNGPCWCGFDDGGGVTYPEKHDDFCIKARQATEPFWKK